MTEVTHHLGRSNYSLNRAVKKKKKTTIHVGKEETGSLPHTISKSQLQCIQGIYKTKKLLFLLFFAEV